MLSSEIKRKREKIWCWMTQNTSLFCYRAVAQTTDCSAFLVCPPPRTVQSRRISHQARQCWLNINLHFLFSRLKWFQKHIVVYALTETQEGLQSGRHFFLADNWWVKKEHHPSLHHQPAGAFSGFSVAKYVFLPHRQPVSWQDYLSSGETAL